jgi:hypothetical protein
MRKKKPILAGILWTYGDIRALAAWIDSDGSIIIARKRHKGMRSGYNYQAEVRVYNTDRRPLDWLASTFSGVVAPHNSKTALGKRPAFYWRAGPIIDAVLLAVLPYLLVKREKAILARELLETNNQEQKANIWAKSRP